MLKFSKHSRLLTSNEFSRVFDDAEHRANAVFTVLARQNTQAAPRLGLIVGKRQEKTAARRNLIKRIVRESFRLNQHQLAAYDFVVLARKGVVGQDKQQLRQAIDTLWKKFTKA